MIKKKDKVYYARILPSVDLYEVCDITVRTVVDNWFVGIDKRDKQSHLFYTSDLGVKVFKDRNEALVKVKEAEKYKKVSVNEETYYEEY